MVMVMVMDTGGEDVAVGVDVEVVVGEDVAVAVDAEVADMDVVIVVDMEIATNVVTQLQKQKPIMKMKFNHKKLLI